MTTLARRMVLKGAGGVALALPWLSSAVKAQSEVRPKRFVAFFHPNGCFPARWFPTEGATEGDFTLGDSHASLAPLRQHCLWLSGVDLKVAVTGPGEQHQRGIGAFLTGQKLQSGTFVGNDGTTAGWAAGVSLDQRLAQVVGSGTRTKSLQLGVHALARDVSGALAYAGPAQPLLPENDPAAVFKLLFGGQTIPNDEGERKRRRRASILDAVKEQFPLAKKGLSALDQRRLDEHLARVRELELRVTALPPGQGCAQATAPATVAWGAEAQMAVVAKLQLDVLVQALACDLTRVATVAFSDAQNHVSMPFIAISSDVHNISHLSDSDPNRTKLATRDAWQAQQFAYFLSRLKETPDGQGATLLDHSLTLWGSELGQGNSHSHANVPLVLGGHAAAFRMGRYVKKASSSYNDLLCSVAQGFGADDTSFGDANFCTGPLSGLT